MQAAQPLRPRLPGRTQATTTQPIRLPLYPATTLGLWPDQWQVAIDSKGTGHIIPRPSAIPHRPGVGGVLQVTTPDGYRIGDPTVAIQGLQSRGMVPLEHDLPVTAWGEERTGYLDAYDTPKGRTHLYAWERPIPTIGQARIEVDTDARIAWLAQQAKRLGWECPTEIMDAIRRELERAYVSARIHAGRSPSHASNLRKIAAKLRAMRWAIPSDEQAEAMARAMAPVSPPPPPTAADPMASATAALAALSPEQLQAILAVLSASSLPAPTAAPAAQELPADLRGAPERIDDEPGTDDAPAAPRPLGRRR